MPTEDPPSRWDADACAYDRWFERRWGSYASGIEHDLLIEGAQPLAGLEVLDAGCGTGRFGSRLEAHDAHLTALDRDRSSLDIARARLHARVIEADIEHLPFADATFDVTFAVTVCEFAHDPAAAVAELARVTRPGGRVVIGSLNRDSPWGRWNRHQFDGPPWSAARFLDRNQLDRLGRRHGATRWRHGLYAPTALPGLPIWGPILERIGRRLAPRHGAFEVLTIDRPPSPHRAPSDRGCGHR